MPRPVDTSWRSRFYPADLPVSQWLAHYAGVFDTVEVNNTFYRLPETSTFVSWKTQTPSGFLMAIKAQVPIIPVAVSGGRDAMRKGRPLIWPVTVKVSLGAPVPSTGLATTDRAGVVEAVRESVRPRRR